MHTGRLLQVVRVLEDLPDDGQLELLQVVSIRDYFAGQALAGLLGNEDAISQIQKAAREEDKTYPDYAAAIAYEVADAMLRTKEDT